MRDLQTQMFVFLFGNFLHDDLWNILDVGLGCCCKMIVIYAELGAT